MPLRQRAEEEEGGQRREREEAYSLWQLKRESYRERGRKKEGERETYKR